MDGGYCVNRMILWYNSIMRFILTMVSALFLCQGLTAQTYTTVQSYLKKPDGSNFEGVVSITPANGCLMVNSGQPFTRSTIRVCVGSKSTTCNYNSTQPGLFSMPLLPTMTGSGTQPTGCYYDIELRGDDGIVTRELWDVPTGSTPVGIGTVRRLNRSTPGATFPLGNIISSEPDGWARFENGRLVSNIDGAGSQVWTTTPRVISAVTDVLCGSYLLISDI